MSSDDMGSGIAKILLIAIGIIVLIACTIFTIIFYLI